MGLPRVSSGSVSDGSKAPELKAGSATGKFEGLIKNNSERDYLNSPDEVLFMQVFVDEVGIWMDSLDRDEHFSRIIPFIALKSPMILDAILACGVKHLTLVNKAYKDNEALFYYNTATTQLLRSLQNPDRDIVECATTAVVLNVYEIMSEKPNNRMSHIAGARALIRECGWNAQSKGIGAACFWLNIGMEVLNCLAFNFATAWKPEDWGVDTSFADLPDESCRALHKEKRSSLGCQQADTEGGHQQSSATKKGSTPVASSSEDEKVWVHRIFYIVAKVVNFRATLTSALQSPPKDEQICRQDLFEKWKRLRRLCAIWNRDCPRSMRPYSYLFPGEDSSKSLFPSIWLVKRTATIGRLFYHTAMILLHQINPDEPRDSTANQTAQCHHAHQVCGIVAHTKDRGTVTVAIRSLAIAAHVLRDQREQHEVVSLFEKIAAETGWRIERICTELKQVWGRESKDTTGKSIPTIGAKRGSISTSTVLPALLDLPPPTSMLKHDLCHANEGALPLFAESSPDFSNTSGHLLRRTSAGLGREDYFYRQHPHQLQAAASAVLGTGTMALVEPISSSSDHSSPTLEPFVPHRLSHMVNPLMHADFSLPDHPYKAFYKPPNESPFSHPQLH
ncbi:hypothetical protein SEPCBS119000_001096 [Sporothrix epigloea]|uniref:C6 zinc finger domain containing protein n=1 Tax=Sporothrix epigloea TaxID=1892477 RepID=A0ABP0DCL4_9PEZI